MAPPQGRYPATRIVPFDAEDAATPIMMLAVDTIASSDRARQRAATRRARFGASPLAA